MRNSQMLSQMSKEEAVFRATKHMGTTCFECVYWMANKYGHFGCRNAGLEARCRELYEDWLDKETDDEE
jgi:hypothetical protein